MGTKEGDAVPTPNDFIAVFDSGVGGISVLRHLRRELPEERFLYFGDSANAPYGTRPTEQILELTMAAAENLISRGIKALVLACNTATAVAAKPLRLKYPDTIIIGIEPAVKLASDRFPKGNFGILATPATLREGKLARLLSRCPEGCHVVKLPAAGLVELVESGNANSAATRALLEPMLAPYAGKLDAVVLGCTHYPFAAPVISELLGKDCVLLDGGAGTAAQTRRRLEQAGLLRQGPGELVVENSNPALIGLCHQLLEESL